MRAIIPAKINVITYTESLQSFFVWFDELIFFTSSFSSPALFVHMEDPATGKKYTILCKK